MTVNLPVGGTGSTGPIPVDTALQGSGDEREIITLGGIGPAGGEVQLTAGQKAAAASIPVVLASDQPPLRITPRAATVSVITTGGTAVIVIAGPINGGYITNPPDDTSQGVTAENLYVDYVAAPGSTDAEANGTTTLLYPNDSFTIQPMASGSALRANAATSGHKFTAVVW